jgi:FeS assembly SUF system regulator
MVPRRDGLAAVLRLSKLTDYAVVVLARLEQDGAGPGNGQVQTAPGLAAATGIAEPTVAKVLKILGGAGLVEGVRGARGGYRLARPLTDLPLSEVIVAVDGPIALTACVDGGVGGCEAEATCPVRGRWDPVNDAMREALAAIPVAMLARPRFAWPLPLPAARPAPSPSHLAAE